MEKVGIFANAALIDRRSFAIKVDGQQVVDAFSPGKAAGGALIATTKTIPVTVRGGKLLIEFVAQGGPPIVAAIEVRR